MFLLDINNNVCLSWIWRLHIDNKTVTAVTLPITYIGTYTCIASCMQSSETVTFSAFSTISAVKKDLSKARAGQANGGSVTMDISLLTIGY